jgi:hypothetical protein
VRNSLPRVLCSLLILTFLAATPAQSQNSDEFAGALSSIGKTYAQNYARPVTDALGADLNAGLFRTAKVGGEGIFPVIDIYVGVTGMGVLTSGLEDAFQIQENDKFESGGNTFVIDYPENTDFPTVFGDKDFSERADIRRNSEDGPKVGDVGLPPGLLDTPIAPLAVPQIGVGTVAGTDAQLRYLPETSISDYGSVSLFGLSVRHSLSQYIPLSPVDLALQGTWQTLSLSGSEPPNAGEVVDASGWALNAQVSRSIPAAPITFYGGVQYEQFGVDVNYTLQTDVGSQDISFSQDASNSVRALAGVSVTLAIIQLNVDYALGSTNTVSAGVGLTL